MIDLRPLIEAAPLGDRRRNDRLYELIATLVAGRAVRAAGDAGWAHAMASYRFFDNAACALPALYGVAIAALQQVVAPRARVYVVHDPSVLDFSHHVAKVDRVRVGNAHGRGYELFTALVLDAQGRPLGPVFQEVRTADGCYGSAPPPPRRRTRPFVGNIEQMAAAVAAARAHLPAAERVHVADCEFDDLELERELTGAGPPSEAYVVRAQHLTRRVTWQGTTARLGDVAAQVRLTRGGRVQKDGVSYRQYVGETRVVFAGPSYRGRHRGQPPRPGPPIAVRVVVAELRARGHAPIRWVLLTDLTAPIHDVVTAYVFRWRVERYFYLTKVGFRVETWLQQNGERIARRLAVSSLAAMVLYQLAALAPDPTAAATLRTIATEGGWLGRKRDAIGPLVLMRGMLRILASLTAIEHLGVARIRDLAELILPGITREVRRGLEARDV